MKLSDLSTALRLHSDVLEAAGNKSLAAYARAMADSWSDSGSMKLDTALPIIRAEIEASKAGRFQTKVQALTNTLQPAIDFTALFSTAAKVRPLSNLKDILNDFTSMSLDDFIQGLREALAKPDDIVSYYTSRLEKSYKDREKFPVLFERLKTDSRVRIGEAKAIAKAFADYHRTGKKADYLDRIWSKHQDYADAVAAGRAMDGKSAA